MCFVEKLKKQNGKDIWLVGGASLVSSFVKENKIDEYYIAIIPVILGDGIPLFPKSDGLNLHLDSYSVFNGMVMLRYSK